MSRTPEPERSPARPSSALARFEAALTRAAMDDRESYDSLVDAARDADAAGEAAAVLRLLANHPRAALRLDEAVRRRYGYRYGDVARAGRNEAPLAAGASRLGVALASAHPDGRVRERAVRRLMELLSPRHPPVELLPFLVVRTADWAKPVRERARGALAVLLHENAKLLIPAAAPITLLISRRERGSFAHQQLTSAMISSPGTAVLDQLLASPDPRLRRLVLQAALVSRRLPLRTLIAVTKQDSDRRCRDLAAEAAAREAAWTGQTDLLRRLAESRYPEVRVLALVGLVRTGLAAEVAPYLDDTSALVRAVARDAARRSGEDALGWYRTAVHMPTPGVIAGLAETGHREDADLLTPLLGHPESIIRAAATRALRALDAVPVEHAVPLLRDPSTKVIREATAALRTRIDQLPAGLAESLLADRDRAAVRRAGYRLLNEPDPLRRLVATLTIATDPDPRLARWAAGAAATLIRGFHPSPWRARTTRIVPAFNPTADERSDLLTLAEAATPLLPHRTRQLLQEHLDTTAPSTELLRVRHGPHPDTKNPLLDVEATFTAEDPHATIARMREVLLAVLSYAAGPAAEWPADEQWTDILPTWFVQRCAVEAPEGQDTPAGRLTWWRGLTRQQRETETRTDTVADWRLLDWINLFDPDGMADSRSWRWWNAGVRKHGTGWVRFGTDGHPYGGREALLWLIEAAGGYDIGVP